MLAVAYGGYVRIFENVNNVWTQAGENILDSNWNISLSSDANVIAIGDIFNDDNGANSGDVIIYDLRAVLSTDSFKVDYFSFFPNPVKDILSVKLNEGLVFKQINLYNIQGQYLFSAKTKVISTKNLQNGMYFIEVETDSGKSAKKIVVE
ncbi:T9SS type A sorting domain-containing protein [Gelidibacter salicanalis]|uniref:T9SS type A sorting domain-containing protein n=1 Tax=Gelidibacter salicanalis TaxID=291193 RepID=A0A934NJA4_9FLAO|nr:T9SS type A sorting domain-containing protein [Gelidibacter salicanalis]MBJ7882238.1 T9SS type A sorting domain-containing protein [Gelidibacter salicanalis]